ncbi:ribosomal-protein-alanine acetyltransferase [Desulfobulbus propionicus DSM 2032]|uniref:[Ribosomal protein bS18]-alanine N-acetyltransferase n=1 Tax=Desulfobulbus propionicus (strain ATCC 33891 / DSM 2032 / VKM B-1956 / 1pr3) TaxID=577650 RepID=A0A7U3YPR6_DESPD|nr:ribosomal protein S18-alanine N-acetyltransferase [Desulfobulbus propionicus]ADW19279.1 ribosomal-protein-alanine acetyltransferase [Desulfobulbus propionicus DSM 2032]
MRIQPCCEGDLEAVARIERQAMPAPWSPEQLHAELQAGNGLGLVARCGAELCGYVFFRTCVPESELLHLVVDRGWRRRGVGEGLLAQGLFVLASQGCTTCFLEVRRSNASALRLYAKTGFCQVGQRKNYYSQPVEDALLLSRDLRAR